MQPDLFDRVSHHDVQYAIRDYVQHDNHLIENLKEYIINNRHTLPAVEVEKFYVNPTQDNGKYKFFTFPTNGTIRWFIVDQSGNQRPWLELKEAPDSILSSDNKIAFIKNLSNQYRLCIYDIEMQKLKLTPLIVSKEINKLSWSPNGRYIAVGGNGASIFDLSTQTVHKIQDSVTCNSIQWSSTGQYCAFNIMNNGEEKFVLQNIENMNEIEIIDGIFFCFSPNGQYYVQGTRFSQLIYDINTKCHIPTQPMINLSPVHEIQWINGTGLICQDYNSHSDSSESDDEAIIDVLSYSNFQASVDIYEYFSQPIPIQELVLLQAIEDARYRKKQYPLNKYWQEIFNKLNETLRILLAPHVVQIKKN